MLLNISTCSRIRTTNAREYFITLFINHLLLQQIPFIFFQVTNYVNIGNFFKICSQLNLNSDKVSTFFLLVCHGANYKSGREDGGISTCDNSITLVYNDMMWYL